MFSYLWFSIFLSKNMTQRMNSRRLPFLHVHQRQISLLDHFGYQLFRRDMNVCPTALTYVFSVLSLVRALQFLGSGQAFV